jgi:hypothetical protein
VRHVTPPGRPCVSDATVEQRRESFTRSPQKSTRRASRESGSHIETVGASHGNLPHVKNFGNHVTLTQIGIQVTISFFLISSEVMFPSASSFILDGLTFSCGCSTLHVSAYMTIFRCV